jgi:hypothetical protein
MTVFFQYSLFILPFRQNYKQGTGLELKPRVSDIPV